MQELDTCVGVECLGELIDGGGNSQSLLQNTLFALHDDVAGPLGEAGQIPLGLDITASNLEAAGLGLPHLKHLMLPP